ncbi:MAG: hypothetical protein K1X82_12475, partial [Bacteroidia bacterium]|nr:hypothetical protein [Bacteroidia bacterium]
GTGNPEATLDIRTLGDYAKGLQLGNSSNRLFFVPKNGGFGFNNLSLEGDAGLFWSDGLGSGDKNQSAGFVLAPFANSANGIRIDANGTVAIGTSYAGNGTYKLAVEGKIVSDDIKVMLRTAWPDYVFEKNHKLMPFEVLQSYVTKNKHLPGIPAAKQVEENGIELGTLNTKLVEKIEELTLYILQLYETNQALKTRLETVESKLKK